QRIPIEYFARAIDSLRRLSGKPGGRVAVFGASRGAEAALMIGSECPEVNGVIAGSGSHVRWEGATARLLPGGPAWTRQGQAMPYVPFHISPGLALKYVWASLTRSSVSLQPMFLESLRRGATEQAEIAVERIRGPVLLGSGADDRKWPSATMSALAI